MIKARFFMFFNELFFCYSKMTDNENIFDYCSGKPININTLWKTG